MAWVLYTLLAVFLILIVVGYALLQKKGKQSKETYYSRYQSIVARLDKLTQKVNYLNQSLPSIKEAKVLDFYESTLRIIDTLLATMKGVSPTGSDPAILNSAVYLINDSDSRVERVHIAFKSCLKGEQPDYDALYAKPKDQKITGCYFCSRPYRKEHFAKTRVKLDGKTLKVISCEICKKELETNKKVKVLHLVKNGKTLHWSEVSDYIASEDYWKLNDGRLDSSKQPTKLTLVVSRKAPLDSKGGTNE